MNIARTLSTISTGVKRWWNTPPASRCSSSWSPVIGFLPILNLPIQRTLLPTTTFYTVQHRNFFGFLDPKENKFYDYGLLVAINPFSLLVKVKDIDKKERILKISIDSLTERQKKYLLEGYKDFEAPFEVLPNTPLSLFGLFERIEKANSRVSPRAGEIKELASAFSNNENNPATTITIEGDDRASIFKNSEKVISAILDTYVNAFADLRVRAEEVNELIKQIQSRGDYKTNGSLQRDVHELELGLQDYRDNLSAQYPSEFFICTHDPNTYKGCITKASPELRINKEKDKDGNIELKVITSFNVDACDHRGDVAGERHGLAQFSLEEIKTNRYKDIGSAISRINDLINKSLGRNTPCEIVIANREAAVYLFDLYEIREVSIHKERQENFKARDLRKEHSLWKRSNSV